MDFYVLCGIEKIVKRYTESYVFGNDKDLNVELRCYLDDEDKEWLLSDIDYELKDLVNFSHEYYDNGLLRITFK